MQFLTIKMIGKLKLGGFQEEMFSKGKINVKSCWAKLDCKYTIFFPFLFPADGLK
jgi:hypothetical protein